MEFFHARWTKALFFWTVVTWLLFYGLMTICIYRELEAGRITVENAHPKYSTSIAPEAAPVLALYYAVPAAVIAFILAATVWEILSRLKSRG